MNQKIASFFLDKAGYDYLITSNGQEALEAITKGEEFDAILMDCMMPVMDGLTATREIRRDARLARLPVIALTAGVLPEERQAALEAGVDDFLTKPFAPERLQEAVRRALQQRRSTLAVRELSVGQRDGDFSRGIAGRDVPDESLMLTGDENMVDVSFRVHPEFSTEANRVYCEQQWERATRYADRILTVSHFSKAEMVAHMGIAAERIDVVHEAAGAGPQDGHGNGRLNHRQQPRQRHQQCAGRETIRGERAAN